MWGILVSSIRPKCERYWCHSIKPKYGEISVIISSEIELKYREISVTIISEIKPKYGEISVIIIIDPKNMIFKIINNSNVV